jgi:dTDP-glucose 4,6-dehydratase
MMPKFFVTGGAGFVGSALVRLLLEAYPQGEVINFDALTYAGNPDNLGGLDERRHRFVRGDVAVREAVREALPEGVEAVFHLAAESHVDRSILAADEFIRTNVLGTQVLLDVARERGARRFVQVSTDEVMGSLPDDADAFFTEDSPFAPNSPYAASKAAAEHLVRAARHTHGLDTVVTRCGNNYGPRQFPEKLLPLFLANALRDEPVPVYGDGLYTRDWIYVDDHARGILAAYENGRAGETYNFGARNARPNLDVIYSLLDALGKPRTLIRYVKDRPGHDRRYAMDPTKAETELGWRPQVSWEQGLKLTIDWYADNQTWVERCRNGEYRAFYRQQYGS